MKDDDLQRAVEAALKAGLRTPKEIASFVQRWLEPIVHLEINEPPTDGIPADYVRVRLTIVKPPGTVH